MTDRRRIEFDDDFESFMRDMDGNLDKAESLLDSILGLTRSSFTVTPPHTINITAIVQED